MFQFEGGATGDGVEGVPVRALPGFAPRGIVRESSSARVWAYSSPFPVVVLDSRDMGRGRQHKFEPVLPKERSQNTKLCAHIHYTVRVPDISHISDQISVYHISPIHSDSEIISRRIHTSHRRFTYVRYCTADFCRPVTIYSRTVYDRTTRLWRSLAVHGIQYWLLAVRYRRPRRDGPHSTPHRHTGL